MLNTSLNQEKGSSGLAAFMAARNLELLKIVEETLAVLERDTNILEQLAAYYRSLRAGIESLDRDEPIDADGKIALHLEKILSYCQMARNEAFRQHNEACSDENLSGDDSVSNAYLKHIAAIEEMFEATEDLREIIDIHDAALEPVIDGVYTSVDDLFKAIESNK